MSKDTTTGAVLIHGVECGLVLHEDDRTCVEGVLTSVWQKTEAAAIVFLVAQHSLLQGTSMYEDKAIEAGKEELKGIINNLVGDPTKWKMKEDTR